MDVFIYKRLSKLHTSSYRTFGLHQQLIEFLLDKQLFSTVIFTVYLAGKRSLIYAQV